MIDALGALEIDPNDLHVTPIPGGFLIRPLPEDAPGEWSPFTHDLTGWVEVGAITE